MTTIRQTRWAVPALALLLVAGVPRDALAFWGIFERLSGPGPFQGVQFSAQHFLCAVKGKDGKLRRAHIFGLIRNKSRDDEKSLAEIECITDGDAIRAHLSVEYSRTWTHHDPDSDPDPRFPNAVNFTGIRPIIFYRVHEWVDLGAGFGANRFSGTAFGFWKYSIPLRAHFFAPGLKSGSKWRSIHLAVQSDYFPGFKTTEFNAPLGPPIDPEFVGSIFISVDLLRWLTVR
jgi:hypothetical protein